MVNEDERVSLDDDAVSLRSIEDVMLNEEENEDESGDSETELEADWVMLSREGESETDLDFVPSHASSTRPTLVKRAVSMRRSLRSSLWKALSHRLHLTVQRLYCKL